MEISKNAEIVLKKRYLIRDADGNPTETVDGLFDRVSSAIAAPDEKYGGDPAQSAAVFRKMMTSFEFLPNSPTLMNAGRPLGQLSACFVLPVKDSMEDIFEAIKQAALIHKSGGGTGFSFSRLRPNGSPVNSTGGVASGPISFMRVFNMATEAVKQGGTRRGANMGILRVDHPDILEFIDCKKNNADITNFNISVGVTEKFMKAVADGGEYELVDPASKTVVRSLPARDVFDRIVDAAWRNGEPGIIFLDRLNRDNVVPGSGRDRERRTPAASSRCCPMRAAIWAPSIFR
jgi:ribonucleoside-diphosphate reductase alpha chain